MEDGGFRGTVAWRVVLVYSLIDACSLESPCGPRTRHERGRRARLDEGSVSLVRRRRRHGRGFVRRRARAMRPDRGLGRVALLVAFEGGGG